MKTDPDFFDCKIAGWWVWGICQWIGSGWCSQPGWRGRTNAARKARGIISSVHDKRPHVSNRSGNGVHRKRIRIDNGGRGVSRQLPQLGGDGGAAGNGIHATGVWKCRPHLGADGLGQGLGRANEGLYEWMMDLHDRLRRVRVCCGDWQRVLGPAVTSCIGTTGIMLDPPYDMRIVSDGDSHRDGTAPSDKLYAHHDNEVSAAVRQWAIENGDNPALRIALCGYEEEHVAQMPESWACVSWKAGLGYANGKSRRPNPRRERIWFSPHCLDARAPGLFDGM